MIDGGEAIRKLALNMARFTGLAPLAKPFIGGIGAILMLHRVTAAPEKPLGINRHLNIAPSFLDRLITDMKANGYCFVTLDEAIVSLALTMSSMTSHHRSASPSISAGAT